MVSDSSLCFLFLPLHEGVQGCACAGTLSSICSRPSWPGAMGDLAVMWFVANTELTAVLMSGGCVVLE